MKEEDCYSARQKPSGGPFNLSILVVYLIKKKKRKAAEILELWPKSLAREERTFVKKKAYRWTQTKKVLC